MMITVITGLNLKAQTKYYLFFYVTQGLRDTIIELGMICACILAIYQISNGAPIGNFVMLISYWGNFTGKPFVSIVVGPSSWLMLHRKIDQFRRNSASISPGSHRC